LRIIILSYQIKEMAVVQHPQASERYMKTKWG